MKDSRSRNYKNELSVKDIQVGQSECDESLPTSAAMLAILKGDEFVFEMTNPEYLQLIGKKNIVGKKLKDVIPGEENVDFLKLIKRVYDTGQTFSAHELQIKIDSEKDNIFLNFYLCAVLEPFRNQEGKTEGILFFAHNITRQVLARERQEKIAEKKLFPVRHRAPAVAAPSHSVWDLDLKTGNLYWSDEYELNFGYKTDDESGSFKSWIDRIYPDDFERVYNGFLEMISGKHGANWEDEYRYIRADGSIAFIYDRGNVIFDKQNEPVRFVGVMQDITLKKEMEAERESLVRELMKSNADFKQFSLVTSHNLRSPVSNILSILDIIDYNALSSFNKEMLELLKVSCRQIQSTVNDLSDILISKNTNVEIEFIDLEKMLIEIKSIFFTDLNNVGGVIVAAFAVPQIFFNKTYLNSIFINLVSNAIKYRSARRKLVINITSTKTENRIDTLTFSDNGIGIDLSQHKNEVFGLYQRFNNKTEGHGLGLFIVKSQVTALGGSIRVESEVDKGTTFIITFKKKRA